jgi:hypothetical protein
MCEDGSALLERIRTVPRLLDPPQTDAAWIGEAGPGPS